MRPWIFVLGVSHFAALQVWAQLAAADVHGPFVGQAVMVGQSAEVHRLPVVPPAPPGPAVEVNPRVLVGPPIPLPFGKPRVPDPLMQGQRPPAAAERTPGALVSFPGIGATTAVPPDPNGDVGPNHYVQAVNTKFAIFDKTGGLLTGPTNINLLFSGLGATNRCATNNDGDPIVVYDSLADRWLLSQFANPNGPDFHVCMAISQTSDPTGSYFLYDFPVPVFPDYFKIGVWPDGYYMSANEGAPGPSGVYALDRRRMLQGLSASMVRFVVSNKNFLMPSNLKGIRPPPPAAPNYFYTFTDPSFWGGGGVDRLELYAFHADFATPASSAFTALPPVNITAFNYTVCGFFVLNCIPQPSPGEQVDAVSEWPMWRLVYRNMRTYETLVGNFTVDVTGGHQAGIRWFELHRSGGGSWTLFQEGTHAPDASHRFMGSIATDANGNIALGYSVSSSSVNPSLRYATRLAGATPGTLEAEATLIGGTGVQTNGFNRWGDYSSMTVDPADDCTFWYTGEYYASTSHSAWSTRIGTFKIASCRANRFDDVPLSQFAFLWIEALAEEGITSGCSISPPLYCPDDTVARAQMAVFLVRGIHGATFAPPAATGTVFSDVPASGGFAKWIEQLAADHITGGCGGGNYCPSAAVTRAEMAIFLLKAKHGAGYTPPPATGIVFGDVPAGDPFAPWIERLAAEGLTSGCGGGNYCPGQAVTRAQMAIFLIRAFGLPV
jgi:hypothetical protein